MKTFWATFAANICAMAFGLACFTILKKPDPKPPLAIEKPGAHKAEAGEPSQPATKSEPAIVVMGKSEIGAMSGSGIVLVAISELISDGKALKRSIQIEVSESYKSNARSGSATVELSDVDAFVGALERLSAIDERASSLRTSRAFYRFNDALSLSVLPKDSRDGMNVAITCSGQTSFHVPSDILALKKLLLEAKSEAQKQ